MLIYRQMNYFHFLINKNAHPTPIYVFEIMGCHIRFATTFTKKES